MKIFMVFFYVVRGSEHYIREDIKCASYTVCTENLNK